MGKLNNLIIRSITGLVIVTLIIGSVFINRYAFGLLFLVFSILGLIEFYDLIANENTKPQKHLGTAIGIIVYLLIFSCTVNIKSVFNIYIIIPILFTIFIAELFRKKEQPFVNIAYTITGIIYIAVPLGLLNLFYSQTINSSRYPEILLMLFSIIWIYDTFAYFTGSLIGKHKMCERLSPKKSWEGLGGGFVFALIFTLLMTRYFNYYSTIQWLFFGIIVIVAATTGDLTESMLKRSINVKDSGKIFPGHGGILDRFDSVLIAVPIVFIYIFLIDFFK